VSSRTFNAPCPACGKPRPRLAWSDHYDSGEQWQGPCKCGAGKPRESWDGYFRSIAEVVATRATCPRASVGAVIVSSDNRLIASGYNGSSPGEPHCLDAGCQVEDGHCQRALHAEVNAIASAAVVGVSVRGGRIYISDTKNRKPCRECTKVIKAAGLRVA